MDTRAKRIVTIAALLFGIGCVALLVYAFIPKLPSTQLSDKTVIIENYSKYTEHISSDSFGYLGNYLYEFINNPEQGVYRGNIVDGSYSYSEDSWFSKFTVKLNDSDVSWKISMQTIKGGEINGDIAVTCESASGSCLSVSDRFNSSTALQDRLPISSDDYIITYQTDNYDTLSIVYYDEAGVGKTKALEKITSLGYKPEDYTIKYFYGGR